MQMDLAVYDREEKSVGTNYSLPPWKSRMDARASNYISREWEDGVMEEDFFSCGRERRGLVLGEGGAASRRWKRRPFFGWFLAWG